jgi:hypothetical protein
VVDRKDLDYQTQKEFDAFEKGSVDATKIQHIWLKAFRQYKIDCYDTTEVKYCNYKRKAR